MFIITCPHCHQFVWIEQINCGIFRHGIYKHNYQQIPPHSTKEECDRLISQDLILGCGKPFQIVGQTVQICDYI